MTIQIEKEPIKLLMYVYTKMTLNELVDLCQINLQSANTPMMRHNNKEDICVLTSKIKFAIRSACKTI